MKPGVHQFEDKLLDFAYGELQPHEAEAVDAHVRGCTKCAASLAQITTVRSQMQTLPQELAPSGGLESLLAFAQQHAAQVKAPNRTASWWQRLLVPMSSVMALLVVGVVAWRAQYTPDAASVAFRQKAPTPMPVAVTAAPPREALTVEREVLRDRLAEKAAPKMANADVSPPADESFNALFGGGTDAPREKREAATTRGADKPAPRADAENKKDRGDYGLSSRSSEVASTGSAVQGSGSSDDRAADKIKDAAPSPLAYAEGLERKQQTPGASAPVVASTPRPIGEPVPAKTSMALGGPAGPRQEAKPVEAEATGALNDGVAQANTAANVQAQAVRSRVSNVFEGQLNSARAANSTGDRQTEIKESLGVINGGAEGAARAEALKRLCDAYDTLGEADSAQVFCDLLVREFPQSAAAKQIALRRSALSPKTKVTPVKKNPAAPAMSR